MLVWDEWRATRDLHKEGDDIRQQGVRWDGIGGQTGIEQSVSDIWNST